MLIEFRFEGRRQEAGVSPYEIIFSPPGDESRSTPVPCSSFPTYKSGGKVFVVSFGILSADPLTAYCCLSPSTIKRKGQARCLSYTRKLVNIYTFFNLQ